MRALVIDVGTTSIRTAIVDESGRVSDVAQRALTVRSPEAGQVELDGAEIARLTLELSARSLASGGACDVVGIANQRATTIVFDAVSGEPVGPVLGWQDLRTVIDCLVLQGEGLRVAPNQTATKATWLVTHSGRDPRELRVGTLESYLAWVLTEGAVHVSDHSNAAITGMVQPGAGAWDERVLEILHLDPAMLPRIVATMSDVGPASALLGAPRIMSLVGDQSASLFGQACIDPHQTKITFGTGAMLDLVSGPKPPERMTRFASGCFPIVARSQGVELVWGVEGIVLSAGTCIEWLRDGLGIIEHAAQTESLSRSVPSSDGVGFVPALVGLGTPHWDFGARGGFFGLTRGSSRAHLVRAVLEGIAQRGADLIAAASAQIGEPITQIRVDGGMTANGFLMEALANASGCVVAISKEREATTRGAGLMALVSAGAITLDDVRASWRDEAIVEPTHSADQRDAARENWHGLLARAARTVPELSAVDF